MFEPRAKRVIFLFMSGGPSHVDLFDPKPALAQNAGKPLPFDQPKLVRTRTTNCLKSPFQFAKHGQSGIEVSDLFPKIAGCIDDICLIRSMVADNINHNGACLQMNTGEQAFSRPSLGSWLLYGLGSDNQNLPGFIVLSPSQPAQGAPLWSSSFLPAAYQGTLVADLANPIANLKNPEESPDRQRDQLDTLQRLNDLHRKQREEDSQLNARIASFELAFRMQTEAPEAFDVEQRVASRQAAVRPRRQDDRDVRQAMSAGPPAGGARRSLRPGLSHRHGEAVELPVVGPARRPQDGTAEQLRRDRRPHRGPADRSQGARPAEGHARPLGRRVRPDADGRERPTAASITPSASRCGWPAAASRAAWPTAPPTISAGTPWKKVHVHDLHATILHLMGLDHEKLTYRHAGRDYRLTDVYGNVVKDILA